MMVGNLEFGNLRMRSVFDLPMAHLHPLIALPIVTKFLA